MTDLRYPVGRFQLEGEITPAVRNEWIQTLAQAPANLRVAVAGLADEQLDTSYREGGWTVRQVVHHLADSHMHSYTRFRFALTEENPAIKPYDENAWADLSDAKSGPLEPSLQILEGVHARWVALARSLTEAEFARTFHHPASKREMRADVTLGLYAWHCRHHIAHITGLRERMGW